MNIRTYYDKKPIPDRCFDWHALDEDIYDGAPDSKTRGLIGHGATEREAREDLFRILDEFYAD